MNQDSQVQERFRQYLLGQLSQEDLSQLEDEIMLDDATYEELLIAEDDLIDQYLDENLSQTDYQDFESHFLAAPERREKLRFARALHHYVDSNATTQPHGEPAEKGLFDQQPDSTKNVLKTNPFSFLNTSPGLSYALVAATLLIVVGLSWVVFTSWRQPTPPGSVVVVTLTPGLVRETGQIKSVRVPPGTGSLQLQLALVSNEYESYRAELLNGESGTVLVQEDLKLESSAGNRTINLTVPSRLVKRDDYRVKLSGRRPAGSYEDVASYVFRVVE